MIFHAVTKCSNHKLVNGFASHLKTALSQLNTVQICPTLSPFGPGSPGGPICKLQKQEA